MKDKNLSVRDLLKQADSKVFDLAEAFGVTRGTLRERLDNPVVFTIEELRIAANTLKKSSSSSRLINLILQKVTPDSLGSNQAQGES